MEFTSEWEKQITKHLNRQHEKETFLRWAKQEKIKKIIHCEKSFEKLIRSTKAGDCYLSKMPFSDHVDIYERFNGSRVMISQPYTTNGNQKTIEQSEEMKSWLDERGLKISLISEELSWHYPGSTILIQIEVADVEKCKEAAKAKRKKYKEIYM